MKLYIYGQPTKRDSVEKIGSLIETIENSGIDYMINSEYLATIEPLGLNIPKNRTYDTLNNDDVVEGSVMLSVGGDGTFLDAVRRLGGVPMPILGVNVGRLGFLAHLSPEDLSAALSELQAGNYAIQERPLLRVSGEWSEGIEFPYAFNEFAIHRHEASMIDIDVYADDKLLAVYRGDGVIAATPTGSTAYSLSAGGPIVSPDCEALVLTALAPHNLSMRPVVMPDTTRLRFVVSTRAHKALAFLDNVSRGVGDGEVIELRKAEISVFLVTFQNNSFYDTLRDKMMWGLDKRDFSRKI
jgi:NAD+ kinase